MEKQVKARKPHTCDVCCRTIEKGGVMEFYYMQDKRQYVGNSMYWWAKDSRGYTCEIRKAQVFTIEEAKKHSHRDTDVLWPKEYIDCRISHHIDVQHCDVIIGRAITMDSF